jgi:hypothetical protein
MRLDLADGGLCVLEGSVTDEGSGLGRLGVPGLSCDGWDPECLLRR